LTSGDSQLFNQPIQIPAQQAIRPDSSLIPKGGLTEVEKAPVVMGKFFCHRQGRRFAWYFERSAQYVGGELMLVNLKCG
jgi:hypothetical protein